MSVYFEEIGRRLGSRVHQLRKQAKLSQAELAEDAHMSETYLSLIESGKCNPSLKKLCNLAEALDIPYEDLTKA